MQTQYLIIAENITYKNYKLSCINIFDHLMTVQLPAEIIFDMAVICGPGWEVGKHVLTVKAKAHEQEFEIGNIEVEIPHERFVYNAIAQDLKMAIGADVREISLIVTKNGEQIIERTYPVNSILTKAPQVEA